MTDRIIDQEGMCYGLHKTHKPSIYTSQELNHLIHVAIGYSQRPHWILEDVFHLDNLLITFTSAPVHQCDELPDWETGAENLEDSRYICKLLQVYSS